MIELEQEETKSSVPMASIKVIGVGGAGGNTVNNIIDICHQSIGCIVANTDAQALEASFAEKKIQLGIKSTRGLGTGADPELGKRAAEEDIDKVMEEIKGADIVFLTAGMGGGTGSGALPVIAHALKEKGILSIAIVTKPFIFEGKKRQHIADDAISRLKKTVDTLIIIPNQKLLDIADRKMSMPDAFALINDLFAQSVKGISDIITKSGYINVDFADVRNIMKSQGLAVMGTASATGENRAQEAALKAISSPLLENMSIAGAHGVLLNITGGPSLGLQEVSAAASVVYDQVDEDAQIIIGSVIDDTMQDDVSVTIIATGFECLVPDEVPVISKCTTDLERTRTLSEQVQVCVQPTYVKKIEDRHVETVYAAVPTVEHKNNVSEVPVIEVAQTTIQAEKTDVATPKIEEKDLIDLSEEEEDAQIRALLAKDEAKEVDFDAKIAVSTYKQDLDIPTFLREKEQKEKKIS